ncbi:MAG: hypothetical protein ACRD47_07415 [Nitrososphaeraceae archaeon]
MKVDTIPSNLGIQKQEKSSGNHRNKYLIDKKEMDKELEIISIFFFNYFIS